MILSGKMISPGVARGRTHVVDARGLLASALNVPPGGPPPVEAERLHAAIGRACVELDRVQRQLTGRVETGNSAIFASHAGLLRDSKFVARIEQQIYEHGQSAEAAVSRVVKDLYDVFIGDPVRLLQDKAADLLDVGRRLLRCLSASLGKDPDIEESAVIVATALTPSELVRFAHQGVAAVITEACGSKSHTAILARGMAIPLITNVKSACETVPHDAFVVVDADHGRVIVPATRDEMELAEQISHPLSVTVKETAEILPAVTADGVPVQVLLNVSDPTEAEMVREVGAAGIGLFRTEFLYMDRRWWPTEDESFAIYQKVVAAVGEAELNIRLVDFGAEKCPHYADLPMNRNPSLGLRGLRLLLQREDIFKPQVKALARIARERPLNLLFPMLDSLDTFELTTEKLCEFTGCGNRSQLPFRLGAMVEVPAAALMIEELVQHVDSIAIGLNDLTQYTLAADRDDEFVERYHDAMQPSVLRLLARIVSAADAAGKPVSICGELAGDPALTGLLLALGLRRLSVSRTSYPAVILAVRKLHVDALQPLGAEVLRQSTASAVRKLLQEK